MNEQTKCCCTSSCIGTLLYWECRRIFVFVNILKFYVCVTEWSLISTSLIRLRCNWTCW